MRLLAGAGIEYRTFYFLLQLYPLSFVLYPCPRPVFFLNIAEKKISLDGAVARSAGVVWNDSVSKNVIRSLQLRDIYPTFCLIKKWAKNQGCK